MADLEALHREVLGQVDRLLAVADDPGPFPLARTPVSGWSPLQHAEHMAKADEASLHQLDLALARSEDGGPGGEAGPRLRLAGRAVLALRWIPRGVGKAPELSRPVQAEREEVAAHLRRVRERIAALGDRLPEIAAGRGRASHSIFGGLTPGEWLRFLWIHHHHHLKIVRDIRKA
ncbi:MAG TPA: DinB family protein [Thermoanaerobaculia bacterium]|nr:DinB family protein [Thermoanaerobaculia bacterium]